MAFGKAKADVAGVQRRTLEAARAKEQSSAASGSVLTAILICFSVGAVGFGGWFAWKQVPKQNLAALVSNPVTTETKASHSIKNAFIRPASKKRERPQARRDRFWKGRCKGGNKSFMCQINNEIKGGRNRKRGKPSLSGGLF